MTTGLKGTQITIRDAMTNRWTTLWWKLCVILTVCVVETHADDNVGIGTDQPDSSAVLDIVSTNKGILIPRLTRRERDAIILPAKSLLIFNRDENRFEYNQGTDKVPRWSPISSDLVWNLQGNAGISSSHFLGTVDSNALIFKTNARERLRVAANGNIGIGTVNPTSFVDVHGNLQLSAVNGVPTSIGFQTPSGQFLTTIRSGQQTSSIGLTLPLSAPAQNQFLISDSSGNMSWKSVSELPSGPNLLNSTLVWNGSSWTASQAVTINNSRLSIGIAGQPGVLTINDPDSNTVSLSARNLSANRTYFLPDAGDTATFIMDHGDQVLHGKTSFSQSVSILGGNELRWYEPASFGSNYVSFQAPALANDVSYTLPSSDGSIGQVLSTNGSGLLSWQSIPQSITGSGQAGTLAFWRSGTSLSSTSLISLDTTTGFVGIGTSSPSSRLTVNNGAISLLNNTSTASELRWYEPSSGGSNFVSLRAPVLANDIILTLPSGSGANGQFLATDGSGQLSWTTGLTTLTGWSVLGNSGSSPTQNFIGTTDNQPLVIRTNNTEVMRFGTNGNVGIGTNNPAQKLSVEGSLGILEAGSSPIYHTIFKAADQATDLTYTLPAAQGSANTVMANDGFGNLSWSTISSLGGVSGSGANGTLAVWNSPGTITNSNLLSFNAATAALGVGTAAPTSRLEVSNGSISLTNTNNTPSAVRWYEPSLSGSNFSAFRAGAQATDIVYTLPTAAGTLGQVLTTTTGDSLAWTNITSQAWGLNGNVGTSANAPASNFIGTVDNQSLALRTNNIERVRLRNDGGIVIGNNTSLSNAYGKVQINDNSTLNGYAALGIISTGTVSSANSITMALQASKQTTSTTNIAGYFIASSGTNNYGLVNGNGGDVFLGQVDSLTPTPLRSTILSNGNPNRTYVHHVNISGELVSSLASGGFGPGSVGSMLVSQGSGSAPQWVNPSQVFANTVWVQGGNALTSEQTLGTNANVALPIATNGIERMRITADGNVGVGTNSPHASSITEITSTTKGILIPRMTSAQRDAITSPAQGLMVYVSSASEEGFWYHNGARWIPVSGTLMASSSSVFRRKNADQSMSNSTTLQDDADLGTSLAPNQIYEVEGLIEFFALTTDPDASFSMSAPAGGSLNLSYTASDGSATSFTSGVNLGSSASTIQVGAGQTTVIHLRGIVETGASVADVRFKWAQNTSNANALTLKRNSYVKFTRVQ